MRMTLKEIADLVGAEIVGDPGTAITGLSTLDRPAPGTLVDVGGHNQFEYGNGEELRQ